MIEPTLMTYEEYHQASMEAGDIDPSYDMLRYVCDRFELNMEQRFWLAFLYATCYCGATTFYMYNEFPDFENLDFGRLERWWAHNRQDLLFQSDRRWTRSRNLWVEQVKSYWDLVRPLTQQQKFNLLKGASPYQTYENAWKEMIKVKHFGRFSMFLYLEAVHVVTGFDMLPRTMDINRDNDSCRGGLCFALGHTGWGTDRHPDLCAADKLYLQKSFEGLVAKLSRDPRNSVWNIETTLCAYRKARLGKRYIGYYIDRQGHEIAQMQSKVRRGVDWSVLWDFRKERYQSQQIEKDHIFQKEYA